MQRLHNAGDTNVKLDTDNLCSVITAWAHGHDSASEPKQFSLKSLSTSVVSYVNISKIKYSSAYYYIHDASLSYCSVDASGIVGSEMWVHRRPTRE